MDGLPALAQPGSLKYGALWQAVIASSATPPSLIDDLYELEQQRVLLNMQISLTHTLVLAKETYLNRCEQGDRVAPTRPRV